MRFSALAFCLALAVPSVRAGQSQGKEKSEPPKPRLKPAQVETLKKNGVSDPALLNADVLNLMSRGLPDGSGTRPKPQDLTAVKLRLSAVQEDLRVYDDLLTGKKKAPAGPELEKTLAGLSDSLDKPAIDKLRTRLKNPAAQNASSPAEKTAEEKEEEERIAWSDYLYCKYVQRRTDCGPEPQ